MSCPRDCRLLFWCALYFVYVRCLEYLDHRSCLQRVAQSSDVYPCAANLTSSFSAVRKQRGALNTTKILCTYVRSFFSSSSTRRLQRP